MLRMIWLATSASLLSSCNAAEHQAQKDIRALMKNPASARFGRLEVSGDRACLEVDGKDSSGAFTGMKTAFLKRDTGGKWGGYTLPGGQPGWDECVTQLHERGLN